MTNDGQVTCEIKNKVSWVSFEHPAHNSMSSTQLQQLTSQIVSEGHNPRSKVIVLQSGGDRTFCAGANFDELASIKTMPQATAFFMGFAQLIMAMISCKKLVVGRIQGKAVGGGVGVVAATDFCMANKWGSVRLSELSIGIGPYVIEPAIRRKIGRASFNKLALNPQEWQDARWAQQHGLYQELFDTTAQMDDYLARYLERLTSYSSEALTNMKQMLSENIIHEWPALLEKRAKMSASLLLQAETQALLKKISGS